MGISHIVTATKLDDGNFSRLLFRDIMDAGFLNIILLGMVAQVDMVEGIFQRGEGFFSCGGSELAFPHGNGVPSHSCKLLALI